MELPPEAIFSMVLPASTPVKSARVGMVLDIVVVPLPAWPVEPFEPQQYTWLDFDNAQLWRLPADICSMSERPLTSTGVNMSVVAV